jgi:hypothetical protein
MRKIIIATAAALFVSCGSTKVVHTKDITKESSWLTSSEDNPIINVIQKHYANDDVEIIIKKKLTTDYVKILLRNDKRVIKKETIRNK